MENTINLSGRRAILTGASRGIGAGIARAMAACGAHLLINHFRDKENAASLALELQEKHKAGVHIFDADISNEEEVKQLFLFADAMLGGVDILVNNAGCETVAHALDLSQEEWDRVFNVNLKGAFMCSQAAGERMRLRKRGVIINISSIHDKTPRKGLVHYCSSKAALHMMTKCLALEWAEFNIRVTAVSPGAIETEMNREEINHFGREKFNHWIPLGRVGAADDIAWACAFLASDKAGYVTATELYIDGGYKESVIPYDIRKKRDKL